MHRESQRQLKADRQAKNERQRWTEGKDKARK